VSRHYSLPKVDGVPIDYDSVEPVYEQIAARLREQIRSRKLRPGQRVPSETRMCQEYEVSRDTVRAAIRVLRDEGLVVTRTGKGSFVARPGK
jgi:DNA-binding GntR family transcriptional regulator